MKRLTGPPKLNVEGGKPLHLERYSRVPLYFVPLVPIPAHILSSNHNRSFLTTDIAIIYLPFYGFSRSYSQLEGTS